MNLDTAVSRVGGDAGLAGENTDTARYRSDSDGIRIIEVDRSAGRGECGCVIGGVAEINETS